VGGFAFSVFFGVSIIVLGFSVLSGSLPTSLGVAWGIVISGFFKGCGDFGLNGGIGASDLVLSLFMDIFAVSLNASGFFNG
jgi:hypothetical protein